MAETVSHSKEKILVSVVEEMGLKDKQLKGVEDGKDEKTKTVGFTHGDLIQHVVVGHGVGDEDYKSAYQQGVAEHAIAFAAPGENLDVDQPDDDGQKEG